MPLALTTRPTPWGNLASTIRYASLTPAQVRQINKLAIQGAEEMVFCSAASDAIDKLTRKFADHRAYLEYVELQIAVMAGVSGPH